MISFFRCSDKEEFKGEKPTSNREGFFQYFAETWDAVATSQKRRGGVCESRIVAQNENVVPAY